MDEVQKRISEPMSNEDLEKYLAIKPNDVMKYSELSKYKTIEDLLPKDKDFQIILIEDTYNSGHWVCVMRYGKTIEYFNSYKDKPDADWKFIPRMMRLILGQGSNEMTRLLNDAKSRGWNIAVNDHKFQKLSPKIQTCGRHCVMRIEMMRMGYNNADYVKKMKDLVKKEGAGKTADHVVSKYVK
jgi:hypothetical protein